MNEELKNEIIKAVQMEYECGHHEDIDGIKAFVNECGLTESEEEKQEAVEFYEELQQLGPAGMLEEYPDLDWDEYFLEEYKNQDEECDETEEEE